MLTGDKTESYKMFKPIKGRKRWGEESGATNIKVINMIDTTPIILIIRLNMNTLNAPI